MPTYIKTGLWFKSKEGHKGTLDLDRLIKESVNSISYVDFPLLTTEPAAPESGKIRIWFDSNGKMYVKNSLGESKEIQYVNL